MLAITQHLLDTMPELSVLMISGSPMIHSFRLPEARFDYVKLPCLGRTLAGGYSVKRLGTRFDELVAVRSQIIRTTVAHFKPDVLLVDKKPRGIADELLPALEMIRADQRSPEVVLLLRDILDDPETTARIWRKNRYFESIDRYYRSILVMGSPDVFDLRKEYRFPAKTANKVVCCGYMRRPQPLAPARPAALFPGGKGARVLVTAGGGEDGFELLKQYMDGLSLGADRSFSSVVVTGPEMSAANRAVIQDIAKGLGHVRVEEFTRDLPAYMQAADLVVSMAGYNTIVELLSMNKRAVVVPRVKPVQEQWIRATRLDELGLLKCIDPAELTPERLLKAVSDELAGRKWRAHPATLIDFDGLTAVSRIIGGMLGHSESVPPMTAAAIRQWRVDEDARAVACSGSW